MGIQLKKVQIGQLLFETHVIARRLRDKQARGEPITIDNFVIDTIKELTGQLSRTTAKSRKWYSKPRPKQIMIKINWYNAHQFLYQTNGRISSYIVNSRYSCFCFYVVLRQNLKQVQYLHVYIIPWNASWVLPSRSHFPILSLIYSPVSFFLSLCLFKTHRITKTKIFQCRPLRCLKKGLPFIWPCKNNQRRP